MDGGNGAKPGRRVWVVDPDTRDGKAWGIISSVGYGHGFLGGANRFVVIVLDGGTRVWSCSLERRGVRWDLAPLDVPAPALDTSAALSTSHAQRARDIGLAL